MLKWFKKLFAKPQAPAAVQRHATPTHAEIIAAKRRRAKARHAKRRKAA